MKAKPLEFLELLEGQVQYVVPRWQRRFRWGEPDIKRLVTDLVSVGSAEENGTAHYGGALLTYRESKVPGVVDRFQVVDGQQRLTTVSILLACIAERLDRDGGECEGWTADKIRNDQLLNPDESPALQRKLKLQTGDDEDYRRFLHGEIADSPGAVPQACEIARRLVARNDPEQLLRGLRRFRVVRVQVEEDDDPQQIFECLNATGRPLTESEKVKNSLLMCLNEETQRELHDHGWLEIEKLLHATYKSEPIDLFLRDLLRWKTGRIVDLGHVYDEFRRWMQLTGREKDRSALFRDLVEYARLYGLLTGTAGRHENRSVERALRHLQALGIGAHRPLTLRLLHDASPNRDDTLAKDEVARAIEAIGTWLTRLWLAADRGINGVDRAATKLASGPGPKEGESFADYWLGHIHRLRHKGVAVPTDEQVGEGVGTRDAYVGHARHASMAVLSALMEAEDREEASARDHLTLEHIMPQKLTAEWSRDLADWHGNLGLDTEDFHRTVKNRLANLTLCDAATNNRLGYRPFAEKREIYEQSPISMTRRLAGEASWGDEALKRRTEDLTSRVLKRWPWCDPNPTPDHNGWRTDDEFRWRIDDGPWHREKKATSMTLQVAAALLEADTANAERLSGKERSRNIHPSSLYPPGTKVENLTAQQIPGYDYVLLFPSQNPWQSVKFCKEMAHRCCETPIAIELPRSVVWVRDFWQRLREAGGVPGQTNNWKGRWQQTESLNSHGDYVYIIVLDEQISLYVRAAAKSPEPVQRLRRYSYRIREIMGDQETDGESEPRARRGQTIAVVRPFTLADKDGWPEAVHWIHGQCRRLEAIVSDRETTDASL